MSFGGGGFNFGTPKSTAPAGGAGAFAFGTGTGSTPITTNLGATAAKAPTTGFNFGQTATTATPGFTLGTPSTTSTAGGLTLGQAALGATQAGGLSLGGTPATGLGGTTTGTGTGLFGAQPATSTPSFGFAKPGVAAASTAPALSLGGLAKPGLGTATAASTATTGLGSTFKLGATTPGLGTLGATTAGTLGATNTTGSIFSQTTVKTSTTGLGGADPKTTTASASTTGDGAKASDGKTVKEQMVEANIIGDIECFKKFIKEEKTEEEHIKRLSSTPMVRVQEDNIALRQLLSVVASGLQRNACAVDKLKREMTQELKNAEMANRTKEIPVGLQYENTAPTQYFQGLVESFENQMLSYRQQIEMLESHLSSIHQPNRLTSDELVLLLRKLHEAFVAMAAQLQQVHEAVKTQKEHYLNYRKVFLGDSRNIFERQKKAPVRVSTVHRPEYGQSPFPGINDTAAVAMASALNRSQQPQGSQVGAPPITGFAQSTGFGATTGTGSFGLGGFGSTGSTGFKGFGTGTSTGGSNLFGNTSNLATTQSAGIFGSSFQAPGTAPPALNLSTSTEQPFQLNKPPLGTKRGKR